jgi:ankyrin repeat protein
MFKALIYIVMIGILNVNSNVSIAQTVGSISLAEQQFFTAVRQNKPKEVQAYLRVSNTVNTLDSKPPNNSALHWAVWDDAPDVLSLLMGQKGVELDIINGVNETPLMIAALKGNLNFAKQLLDAGAYPNKEGWTPLHYAATEGHIEMMKLLLEAHAYIDAESPNKTTPLMMAALSKNILAVKLLLDEGADMTLLNEEGWSVITFAQKADAVDIVEGLQLRAEKIKQRDNKPARMR